MADFCMARTLIRRAPWLAASLLLAFGAARLPLENGLQARLQAAGFQQTRLDLELREQLGQSSFIAALSGFRALVAAFLWIEAHDAWRDTTWGRMNFLLSAVTSLQPLSYVYWSGAAWHMAWNAGVAARQDKSLPTEAQRARAERQYWDIGEAYFQRGLGYIGHRWELWRDYAWFLDQKRADPCAASAAYDEAARRADAPDYLRRMAAFQLAKCPGREREAYDRLRALHDEGVRMRLPTLMRLLGDLENELEIPPSLRVIN